MRLAVFSVGLMMVLAGGECLTGFAPPTGARIVAERAEIAFDRFAVQTGLAERQTVLTGFLLGGAVAEIAVVNVDESGDRRVRVYTFGESGWAPDVEARLGPEVMFVDVANIGGRDLLITYAPGRLSWLDFASTSERPLMAITSGFEPPRVGEIPHVDITRDVNGDARDDLVVPDVDGFWVLVQTGDGAFADPVKIGPPTDMSRIYGADGYRYDPWAESRIHEIDYNGDGRSDLVFWNEDRFEAHLQNERGLFTAQAEIFTTDVAFDSDDLSSLTTGDMTGKVLYSLADLNGDGVGDLVVFSLQGRDISDKRSAYEVHLGALTADGGTVFAPGIDRAFRSAGRIQLGMDRYDLDHDGQVELMFTTIDLGYLEGSLWKRLKGAMGDDVWLDLEFYRMDEGRYPGTPNPSRSIQLDGVPSPREPGWVPLEIVLRGPTHEARGTQDMWPRAFNTTLRIGDLNGDGHSELLIAHHPRIMQIFAGVAGPDLFAAQPQEARVAPPNDEEYTWLVDLDNDGKQDIVMHHRFTERDAHGAPALPPGTEPQRVVTLLAR